MTLFRRDAQKIIDTKFEILDRIRKIEAKVDFPVSISVGMGFGADTIEEEGELAEAALNWQWDEVETRPLSRTGTEPSITAENSSQWRRTIKASPE